MASHLHHGWARLNESLLLEEAVDYCWKEADTGLAALRRLLSGSISDECFLN